MLVARLITTCCRHCRVVVSKKNAASAVLGPSGVLIYVLYLLIYVLYTAGCGSSEADCGANGANIGCGLATAGSCACSGGYTGANCEVSAPTRSPLLS